MAKFVWCKDAGKFVPAEQFYAKKYKDSGYCGITIIKDLEPYRNVIDRRVIGGRREHRDFLRAHGVEEVGNEKPSLKRREAKNPPGLKQAIKQAIEQVEGV